MTPCASSSAKRRARLVRGGQRTGRPASLHREARAFAASQPTALERDTLLVPEWIAESVVQEAERFLQADLPANFAARLAAKAHHLYPRHRHFKKMLNRPGNRGRNNLYVYMRHWTAAWLKREHSRLFKLLPWEYAQGIALPVAAPGVPKHYPDPQSLVMEDCIKPGGGNA
jgi:hypothetical protein